MVDIMEPASGRRLPRILLDCHFRGQSQDQRPQVANSPKRAEIIWSCCGWSALSGGEFHWGEKNNMELLAVEPKGA